MKRIVLVSLLLVMLLASCKFVTDPMPLYGNYLAKENPSSHGYIYCFTLRKDGTFSFIQRGGATTTDVFIFEGTWNASLNHFDFYNASGIIVFTPEDDEEESGYESLIFTEGQPNQYRFQWTLDSQTVNATMSLEAISTTLSRDIGTVQNISDDEFEEKYREALGLPPIEDEETDGEGEGDGEAPQPGEGETEPDGGADPDEDGGSAAPDEGGDGTGEGGSV